MPPPTNFVSSTSTKRSVWTKYGPQSRELFRCAELFGCCGRSRKVPSTMTLALVSSATSIWASKTSVAPGSILTPATRLDARS